MTERHKDGEGVAQSRDGQSGAAKVEHTPTPWVQRYHNGWGRAIFGTGVDRPVVSTNSGLGFHPIDEDVAFILRAVNNHEQLVDAARWLLSWVEKEYDDGSEPLAARRLRGVLDEIDNPR